MISTKHFLWTLPFFCFLATYFIAYWFLTPQHFLTPSLIGKPLQEALHILSDRNLNTRIITQKEDKDLASGTIISQIPEANRSIRAHQSIFLVISKQPKQKVAPNLLQKSKETIEKMALDQEIKVKYHYLPSHYPENSTIGQIPSPNQPIVDNKATLYLSQGSGNKPVLLPSFKKKLINEVVTFLEENKIKFNILHTKPIDPNHTCKSCIVIDQRPLAGSLIDLKKPLTIQLHAK